MDRPTTPASRRSPVVVVGEFDGFHVGHRRLLGAAGTIASREQRPLVAVVLDDQHNQARLSDLDDVCRRIVLAGASATHVLTVDARAASAGPQVVAHIAGRLEPSAVVMACLPQDGGDARYPELRPALVQHRIDLVEVDRALDVGGQPISSTGIRAALLAADVAGAAWSLGEPYALRGEVVHGSGLGHTIGFPTANVPPPIGRLLPALGVYAATVRLPGGATHRAAVNVGVRPTVELAGSVLIEAHLLDFDADIYGVQLDVRFRERLRGELRFASVDELIAQMHDDVAATRTALATP
jgi:riboflavin kinase/FMN adenylyltransferase